MSQTRNIGVAPPPTRSCTDKKCPFHGNLSVRGRIFEGTVVSDKMIHTVTVERRFLAGNEKYKRYERKFTKFTAHNPPCLDVKEGDRVRVGECRPLSKTVHFVVIEKLTE
ncbi:MAG: 30S ribosomal protein S17 [Promethearchaeota archaeon]